MKTEIAIKSLKELRLAKLKLKDEIAGCELKIQQDIELLEKSLQPANLAVDFVKKYTKADDSFLGLGVYNVIGKFAYNTVFAGYSWPVRTALTFVSKRVLGNIVKDKVPGLLQKAAKWWQQRRNAHQVDALDVTVKSERPEFA